MKKFSLIALSALLAVALTACSASKNEPTTADASNDEANTLIDTQVSDTELTDTENNANEGAALAVLNNVWNSYADDEKFPAASGVFDDNAPMDAPGEYSIEDASALDTAFALPAEAVEKIDGAASLMHMMNANTFTCGAFHVKDASDVEAVATAIRENIKTRQWMCGFPDKLVIIGVDDVVVSAFGNEDNINTFKEKTTAQYENAVVIVEDVIE